MSKPMDRQVKYLDIIANIDKCYKKMKTVRPIPQAALKRYRDELNILSSYYSNSIEGNTFTYDETRLLIKDGVLSSARTLRENEDIVGHSKAFNSLYESVKSKEPITEAFIKKLHAMLLRGDDYAGKYRDASVYIGDAISISYVAPPSEQVEVLIKQFVSQTQSDIDRNIKQTIYSNEQKWVELFGSVARHHLEFERIHPFFDGNGRTGRLLLNYELLLYGLLPVNITNDMRSRYGAAFERYEQKERYSTRADESKYERMAKLLAECELNSMIAWGEMFENYFVKTAEDEMEL